jgi:DNA-binding response OmpR family regulator
VSAFPSRYDVLTVLVDSAASGDGDALVELQQAAHRLVGRAGATQFLRVAEQASALESLALVDGVAQFDGDRAADLLSRLWVAFNEERTTLAATDAQAGGPVDAKPTVLVGDDDEDQRYLISRLLGRSGFTVVSVTRGADILPEALRCRPAAILLDVQMPDQDGFTTARQLKARPETAATPLVFLTGRSTVDDRLAGLRLGADDYLSKSVDPRELVLRVQKLCDRAPAAAAAATAAPPADAGASRSADAPWLTRDRFEHQVRERLARTWGSLVLVRGPHDEPRIGQWLAEQFRRRDLIGDFGAGQWALFLPEESGTTILPRLTTLLSRLKEALGATATGGLATSAAPGASLTRLLDEADQALAHARSRGVPLLEYATATASPTPAARDVRQRLVLLTDDDPEVTRITDAHVRASGYRTQLAFDGDQALQVIRVQKPDAVVLDLMLPKRTGFDVLAEVRQMPPPRPHVLVLSARGREEDVTRAFGLGADDYMIKPFSPQELIARLGRLLR